MTRKTTRKTPIRKKTLKKKQLFLPKLIIILSLIMGIAGTSYHYKNAILYYLSFKTNKIIKQDKLSKARIHQVLKNHNDKVIGFDVSQYQGNIDWNKVDSLENHKLRFVFIRATAGSNLKDSQFDQNWAEAKKRNLICGAYHYYRPNENSIEQAKNFIHIVKLTKGNFPPVLDIEKLPSNQSIDSLKVGLKRWLTYVDNYYKVKPIIYTGEKYYEDFLKDEFQDYSFWVANYNPWVESIDNDWLFWQFTDKAVIKGINEKVDINIYNGTLKMLEYLTISN